jgi:hypothetical protein
MLQNVTKRLNVTKSKPYRILLLHTRMTRNPRDLSSYGG